MAVLAGSPVTEGVTITNPNIAYETVKLRGLGGRMEDDNEKYTSPPTSHQPLPLPSEAPPTSSNVGVSWKAESLYRNFWSEQ